MDAIGRLYPSVDPSSSSRLAVKEITERIDKPAGLPRDGPTQSYWQQTPHAIAEIQSKALAANADFVIIGSGMTGVAAAKTLLEADSQCKVVVLEARAICSGATGRNGGHLKSSAVLEFGLNSQRFGPIQAERIVAYQALTCDRVQKIAKQYCATESEIRSVDSIGVFEDPEMMNYALSSISDFKAFHADYEADYQTVEAKVSKASDQSTSSNLG